MGEPLDNSRVGVDQRDGLVGLGAGSLTGDSGLSGTSPSTLAVAKPFREGAVGDFNEFVRFWYTPPQSQLPG
jgi:hypothetical protein